MLKTPYVPMDANTNKIVIIFGAIISICAIIVAAGSIVSMAGSSVSGDDISDWEEMASGLDEKGGTVNFMPLSGSTYSTYNQYTISAASTVTAEQGYLKVVTDSGVIAIPYTSIIKISYSF